MAKTIFSRTGNRGRIADPRSGLRRKPGGVYKPRSGRRPSRGGLPTDPSPAVRGQMRAQRGTDLAKSQIRATGRATPETLGAALDRGDRRSPIERGESRLSRKSMLKQQGKVFDSRGVPMTEAQREQRGQKVAGIQRDRLAFRRRARARMPDPAGSMSVQFAGKPERTLRGESAKLGGGITTPQGAEDMHGFRRDVRQDAFKQRFPSEMAQGQQELQAGGMDPYPAYRATERGLLDQYAQIPQDVESDMLAKHQVMDPLETQSQAGLDARLGRQTREGQQPNAVQASQTIPNFPDFQRTARAGFYPVQDAMVPAAPVAQAPVAYPELGPAPIGMTPQEQTERIGVQGQADQATANIRQTNVATDIAARDAGLPIQQAGGQVAPGAQPRFVGTPEAQATSAQSYIGTQLPDDIFESTSFSTPVEHSDSIRRNLARLEETLMSQQNEADKKAIARQMMQHPSYQQLQQMANPSYRFITAPLTSPLTYNGSRATMEGALRQRGAQIQDMIEYFAQ